MWGWGLGGGGRLNRLKLNLALNLPKYQTWNVVASIVRDEYLYSDLNFEFLMLLESTSL